MNERNEPMRIISAICTPLQSDDSLHVDALHAHIDAQWSAGVSSLLVAGTMGLMQLQSDRTYCQLVSESVEATAGRGELLIGVGDTSTLRTQQRIAMIEQNAIDGVVALPPFFLKPSQPELIDHYHAIADSSSRPVYLYDLPQLTGVKLELDTVVRLSKHANIHGIKVSVEWGWTRQLIQCVDAGFRVIPAQAHLVDMLARERVPENMDGVFSLVPRTTLSIVQAVEAGNDAAAAQRQQQLSDFHRLINRFPLFGAGSAFLNACGIPGKVSPAPIRRLTDEESESFLAEPLVQALIEIESPAGQSQAEPTLKLAN